jgi:hypothetical protein
MGGGLQPQAVDADDENEEEEPLDRLTQSS